MSAQYVLRLRKWLAAKIWTPPMPTPWQRFREDQLDIEEYEIFHTVPEPVPDTQEAARLAWENCSTHPRPGELVKQFNRVKQASNPPTPLPPVRRETDAIPPVRRQTSAELMPTLRANTGAIVQHISRAKVANIPTQHDTGAIPQDHFLVAGPDMLFVPLDQVPTVTPLSGADRSAMAAAAEMPRQPTGYLDELATLRHNSDTLEVPAYVKQKHTKESE